MAATATGQDLLHYKFDEVYGSKVVNYAAGSLAPSQGTIVSSLPGAPAASWAPGRFGAGALAGSIASPNTPNRLDTGWVPGTFSGSLSYALWLKVAYNQPAPSLCYVFGSPTSGQFRVFTGGSGIWFTSGAGFASQSTLANIYNLANGNWVHLAFVADAASLTATYFVNGVAEPSRTITVAPTWTSPVPFTVGQQLVGSAGSIFDIDEFLLANRAMTAVEIAALAQEPRAGNAGYGSGCGPLSLGSVGGVPALGNFGYGLELSSPQAGIALLGIGGNRATYAGQPLPFDLGSLLGYGACTIDSSFDLTTLFAVLGPQPAVFGMPIPPLPAFLGVTFYAQAPGLLGGSSYATSNAFAIAIGG